jgi:FkbM family methyltransferase
MSAAPGLRWSILRHADLDDSVRASRITRAIFVLAALRMEARVGSFPHTIPFHRELIDYWLTRIPRLYLSVELHRRWINWDKRVYLSFVRRGDVVLDVGANVGTHTVFLSHLVGQNGMVIAVEPVPRSFEQLQKTIRRRARFPNVLPLRLAFGETTSTGAEAVIRVPGNDFTQASLREQTVGSWERKEAVRRYTVSLTTLDEQVRANSITRLDFVKIDVEGGELGVLRGGAEALTRFRPFLYCEVYERWSSTFGYSSAELLSFVRSLGYTDARVMQKGQARSLSLEEAASAEWFADSSDVLFSASKHAPLVRAFDKRFDIPSRSAG